MANQFAALAKTARVQISRRSIDSSLLNVTVNGNVVHITGVIRPLRDHPNVDMKEEMNCISQILRHQAGIHEVVWEVSTRV